MKRLICLLFITALIAKPFSTKAQFDEDQLGAWYMYFWNTSFNDGPWGLQGDLQHRNWDLLGDLEQLMLRGGLTYQPEDAGIKFTLGYANIQTGAFGSDNDDLVAESRIYQEALFPQKLGGRFHLNHRFRYEQRFVDDQDMRTRYRYNLFINVALNSKEIDKKTYYLALYNELFINGEREIGDNRKVEIFDRNRSYAALGYAIQKQLKGSIGCNASIDR